MNTPPEFEDSGPGNQNDNFDDEEGSELAKTYLWGRYEIIIYFD